MPETLFDHWCERRDVEVAGRHNLYVLTERAGARSTIQGAIDATVASHYVEPARLSARIARLGYTQAAEVLRAMLPQSKRARSGHLGEILATEAAPAILSAFEIPIKRLRWTDGRESALRGEDLIGIARESSVVRFLKGESKSRLALTPSVVAEARETLNANDGRPSQHALGFIMNRLFELGQDELALIFEEYMLLKSIPVQQLVHLTFTLSENDASGALQADLGSCGGSIEQHAITIRIQNHQEFIASVYSRLNNYAT